MSLITDYASLQAAVQSFLVRSDVDFANNLPIMIQMAESRIKRLLRIREMEQITNLATTAGVSSVALPAGYIEGRRMTAPDGSSIDYRAPTQFYGSYDPQQSGVPAIFTIEGENIILNPTPNARYSIAFGYYGIFASLSSTNTSNALLQKYPDVYFYGTLVAGEQFQINDARMPMWKAEFEQAVAEVDIADMEDRHSGGPLTISSDVAL